jgi:predicted ATPase
LVAAEATGTRLHTPLFLTLLTEALALAGKIEEGLAALDDGLAKGPVSGEKGWDADIHRLRGELTPRLPYPDPVKAEASFRTALAVAREQGTRGYELRAATSLAGCGASRAGGARPASCWHPSTTVLPKGSTPPI